jgi:hypothetical protein
MAKLLSDSRLDRKNILNNPYAVDYIYHEVGLKGFEFDGEYKYTIDQVVNFFEVDLRTIRRYLAEYGDELGQNGYQVLTGEKLKEFVSNFASDINVTRKTRNLGIFNFKALLNLGMLLVESERARLLRNLILNVVIDVIAKKTGGDTKYINQRDESYLISLYAGQNYRVDYINALKECVDIGNYKYAIYTNKIYKSIFKEHSQEYKQLLNLKKEDKVRDTLYSEVLTTIAMYEAGLADRLRKKSNELKRKLTTEEVDVIFTEFENDPAWKPQLDSVRIKMASRDYGLRSITHPELKDYITPLNTEEFERFLGEKSMELAKRIEKYQGVFKRLKDK